MASDAAARHRADVEKLAPSLAEAITSHLEAQRKKAKRTAFDSKTENATLKAVILPHTTKAVQAGAARVASVVGNGTPSPTTTLAGAWAYKAAAQINSTTQGAVDEATTDEDTGALTHAFDVRVGLAGSIAAGIISTAINSGAFNYAKTSTTPTTKTWEVTDAHPCATCSEVDGETVPSPTDFSNGAPFPSIHDGCMCTVSFTAASSTSRSQRSVRMGYHAECRSKYSADDMKDLLAKGKAMKNATGDPSYPVNDEEDVKKAIKAVGRGGADHDAIRKHVMKGAKALGLTSLIPDTWNADGSLKTTKARWTAPDTREARADASLSFGDVQSLLYAAIVAASPFGQGDIWIVDCGPDWVVWHDYDKGGAFKVGYSIGDDNAVSFTGQAVAVAEQTTYVPVGSTTQTLSDKPAGESRANAEDTKQCPLCKGTGKIRDGNVTCPTCKGTGKIPADVAETTQEGTSANHRRPRRQRRSLDRLPEWRTFKTQFERRVATDGTDIVLSGYPIRYATPYDVRDFAGSFRETMHPGVAGAAMGSRDFDCRFLVNHEGMPLARSLSGTLVMEDTKRGLRCEPHLDGRQQAAVDLAVAVERGDVSQMSCGFIVATGGDEWRWGDDDIEERDVYEFEELFDVSAVTYPASPTTSIELAQRALARAGNESRERIRRLFLIGGSVRSGDPLSRKDGEDLRAVAEALYKAEEGTPLHVQLEMYRSAVSVMERALRVGKVLSGENEQALQEALDALHAADDIDIPGITRSLETIDKALDAGQAGLAEVLGKANPDGDPTDQNPTLVKPTDPAGDKDARQRQAQMIRLRSARQLLVG